MQASAGGTHPVRDYSRADRITLTGVQGIGYHGVLDTEKQTGQPFIVDATLFTSTARAAGSDNLADTVNYAEVAELIHGIITGEPLDLIETLAENLASSILATFPSLLAVELTVNKPQAPIEVPFSNVAVTVWRENHDG